MSEYRYYEFRAIDRPLGRDEMDELRALSTRAEIASTSLINTYHYGSFKGKPSDLMDRYFDAFVYVANWGSRRLMFRIPRGFLDVGEAEAYCDGEAVSLTGGKEHVVLDFRSEDESYDEWTEGEHWMSSLVSIRDELMRGDLRALYLAWLASAIQRAWNEEDVDNEREPPVPPGLAKLSVPLQSLADFLRVDDELLEVAATNSKGDPATAPSKAEMARWVKSLPAADKDAYLVRFLAEEGDVRLRAELSKRFRETTAPRGKGRTRVAGRRTVAQLLAARDALVEDKSRTADERAAEERARYLDQLALREPAAWRDVEQWIASKRAKDYDQAVTMLVDLRDLADRAGRSDEARRRIHDLIQRHATKRSLLQRIEEKKLGQ